MIDRRAGRERDARRSHYDRDARIALRGKLIPALLERCCANRTCASEPPKTAGREQFGQAYAEKILAGASGTRASTEDLVRTATMFTSLSIADAFRRFILPRARVDELIVAGGGAQNPLMMAQLAAALPGIEIVPASEFGIPAEAKEAFAFAVLAYEAYHGRANNLPSATGARHRGGDGQTGAWTSALGCVLAAAALCSVCVIAARVVRRRRGAGEPGTVNFLIESMPTNLDPRIGTDAQSQHLDGLIFDSLRGTRRADEHHSGPGGALGSARSADVRISFAAGREISRWARRSRPRT